MLLVSKIVVSNKQIQGKIWDNTMDALPVLVLLFVALWFILRGDLFYVLPCVILFLRFSVLLALRLPRLEKRELIVVL